MDANRFLRSFEILCRGNKIFHFSVGVHNEIVYPRNGNILPASNGTNMLFNLSFKSARIYIRQHVFKPLRGLFLKYLFPRQCTKDFIFLQSCHTPTHRIKMNDLLIMVEDDNGYGDGIQDLAIYL